MEQLTFAGRDVALILVYFAVMLAVGWNFRRSDRTSAGYFLAGRTLTLPAFVATLVSTWYGGILGVGEFSHQYGLSNWVVFGLPYYVFAAVFAVWLAPRIRAAELYTIPDKIAAAYGRSAALVAALFVYLLTNPAAYVLMLATLLRLVFPLPLWAALILGVLLSTVYVYTGGFRADVRVNQVQFALMFLGFFVLLPVCVTQLGGWRWLTATLRAQDAGHLLTWTGGNSPGYVVSWFFIALWTLVDPGFHQRCYAARDGRTARRGILVSIACWAVFDCLTTATGLYARAALPDIDPKMAYPLLAERLLPPGLKGLFFVALLATVMSTLVSYTFLCSVTFARDIVWRLRGGDEDAHVARWSAVGLALTSVLAIALALAVPSVVDIWWTVGTIFVPGLLLPLLTAYSDRWRVAPATATAAALLAAATSLLWLLEGRAHAVDGWPVYPAGLEPMYPGLAVSLLLFGGSWLRVRLKSRR